MLTDRADDPDVRDVIASETKLFDVRVNGRAGQKAQLRERVMQQFGFLPNLQMLVIHAEEEWEIARQAFVLIQTTSER